MTNGNTWLESIIKHKRELPIKQLDILVLWRPQWIFRGATNGVKNGRAVVARMSDCGKFHTAHN